MVTENTNKSYTVGNNNERSINVLGDVKCNLPYIGTNTISLNDIKTMGGNSDWNPTFPPNFIIEHNANKSFNTKQDCLNNIIGCHTNNPELFYKTILVSNICKDVAGENISSVPEEMNGLPKIS